jgi:hypothetical protein
MVLKVDGWTWRLVGYDALPVATFPRFVLRAQSNKAEGRDLRGTAICIDVPGFHAYKSRPYTGYADLHGHQARVSRYVKLPRS